MGAKDDYHKSAFKDTEGLIKIAFGKSESDIREGLEMCENAKNLATKDIPDDSPQRRVAEAYYQLHQRRAWRRLLEFD